MEALHLAGKRVLVVGAGRSGVGVARYACRRGAEVTLTDTKSETQLGEALAGLPAQVERELGGHRLDSFLRAQLIILSPGVAPTMAEIQRAREAGVAITGEIELAARSIAAPIVGITGTNGKSTVTTLCGEIARATGRPTFVGGNLGTPLIECVGTPAAGQEGIVVVELSSFQLETCQRFRPRAAVLLNITPDHLDRYRSFSDYADAKLRVAQNLEEDDLLVVNADDGDVAATMARHPRRGRRLVYSTREGALTEGRIEGDALVLHLEGGEERYPTRGLALVGKHNWGNALAAFLAMRGAGLASAEATMRGAATFRPLPHRMELAGEHRGVLYYDDSKGTNVAAVVASLDGFPRPFALIAGGRDKGGSYAPLREMLLANRTRAVVLIGEAADRMAEALRGAVAVRRAGSMEEAVAVAAALTQTGDAVVLSPACSSYDMFRNYEHRGRAFCEAVARLG